MESSLPALDLIGKNVDIYPTFILLYHVFSIDNT